MGKINEARLVLGGVVGGLVAAAVDFLLNGVVLKSNWDFFVAQKLSRGCSLGTVLPEIALVVVIALLGTYVYALARPRLGGNPSSALRVAIVIGALVGIPSGVGTLVWSTMNPQLGWMLMANGFIVPAVGTFVGAWVYKE